MSFPGTVVITVISVDNVPVADLNGKSDPYVTVEIGSKKQKTTVKKKELNPVYNECMNFLFIFFPFNILICIL